MYRSCRFAIVFFSLASLVATIELRGRTRDGPCDEADELKKEIEDSPVGKTVSVEKIKELTQKVSACKDEARAPKAEAAQGKADKKFDHQDEKYIKREDLSKKHNIDEKSGQRDGDGDSDAHSETSKNVQCEGNIKDGDPDCHSEAKKNVQKEGKVKEKPKEITDGSKKPAKSQPGKPACPGCPPSCSGDIKAVTESMGKMFASVLEKAGKGGAKLKKIGQQTGSCGGAWQFSYQFEFAWACGDAKPKLEAMQKAMAAQQTSILAMRTKMMGDCKNACKGKAALCETAGK